MPTKRRKRGATEVGRVTPDAIDAWRAGDYWGLHRALRLKLWQMPDWNCDAPDPDEPPTVPGRPLPPDTAAFRRALIEIAGPPPKRWVFRQGGY
jgi:hypothetical protein